MALIWVPDDQSYLTLLALAGSVVFGTAVRVPFNKHGNTHFANRYQSALSARKKEPLFSVYFLLLPTFAILRIAG